MAPTVHGVPFPSARGRLRGFDLVRLPADFGDWRAEARACREGAALFDYSSLVTIEVRGPRAGRLLSEFCARPFGDMRPGTIRYALTANGEGWLVSDLTVWRVDDERFLVMTGRPDDLAALRAFEPKLFDGHGPSALTDRSHATCVLALQGPAVRRHLAEAFDLELPARFQFVRAELWAEQCVVGGIGYTGEDGVEILCTPATAARLWSACRSFARPAGFRAADLLRLEAGLALFSREFALPVTPTEAGFAAIRADDRAPELTRIRALARAVHPDAVGRLATPDARPAPGEMAITSSASLDDSGTALVMGYVRRPASPGTLLHDPLGNFDDLRPIAPKGLVRANSGHP